MALDRDELAARCLVALLSGTRDIPLTDILAVDAVNMADALLARLRPEAVAPAPSPAAWVPKVGDKVRYVTDEPGSRDRVVVGVDALGQMTMREVRYPDSFSYGADVEKFWRYVGPATSSERAAAGLTPAESARQVDREGFALRLRVAEAVFGANDRAKNPDDYCRCQAVYVAALGAIGYDWSWATRSVSSFIEHLKANGGVA